MRQRIQSFLLVMVIAIGVPMTKKSQGQSPGPVQIHEVDLSAYATHPTIAEIVQDRFGFIWMASDFGLFRYDGVHLRAYNTDHYPDLPGNVIHHILFDREGMLWIATDGGLAIMDIEAERINTYSLGSESDQIVIPRYIFQKRDGEIWLGLENSGIARLLPGNPAEFYHFEVEGSKPDPCFAVTRIFETDNGHLLLEAGCRLSHRLMFFFVDCDHPESKFLHSAETGTAQLFSFKENVFLIDRIGFRKFDSDLEQFVMLSDQSVFSVTPEYFPWIVKNDNDESLWIGGLRGHLSRSMVVGDTLNSEFIGKIGDVGILDVMEDRSGCLWVGTQDGAFYFSPRNRRFVNYLTADMSEQRYGLKMRAIVEYTDNMIYAGATNGMHRLNTETETTELIALKSMSLAQIYSICKGNGDYLWVGSDGYGMAKFDPEREIYYDRITTNSSNEKLRGGWVGELVMDSDTTLWIGTDNGINYILNDDDDIQVATDFGGQRILPSIYIHDIKELRKSQYWIGTSKGLFHLAIVGNLPEGYFIVTAIPEVPYKIREISRTSGSDLWLATEDAGLVHYDPENKSFEQFTMASGLPSDVLYSLLPGPEGELWIGTFEGLSRFEISSQLFSNFYVTDGLPHNEFNSQSQLIASDGTFYMGTQNGIVSFNPSEFKTDSSDLPIMINSVTRHNTRFDSTSKESSFLAIAEGLHIGPYDNLVTINYAIADYNKLEGNRFQYLLEGLYEKWHYVGNETELVLPHLSPGNYTLRIRGAGSDGRWSTAEAVVPISVSAIFYKTWWFQMSVLSVLAMSMWLLHRNRLKQVLRMQNLRLRIAEDLHDELGSSLTGVGMQAELLKASESSLNKASKLDQISAQIREAVSKLDDIVWALNTRSGTLGDLMDRMEEQIHIMLVPAGIDYNISVPRDQRELLLNNVVMQNCFLIFKEAITNIVKHSAATYVDIEMHHTNSQIMISVSDNGKTNSPVQSGSRGNGLKNMQKRAKKMSGELSISAQDGFRIDLTVPKAFTT